MDPRDPRSAAGPFGRREWLVCGLLTLATIAVYAQTSGHDFVNHDDPVYVTENPPVLAGLSGAGIVWAFTTGHGANWHPLTWLSHMLDCQLFGANPGPAHLTSVGFHVLNALLLFLALRRLTGETGPSGFVAALFALHPLHVESVAWIAERKDVLSTFFWMLVLCAYASYVERPALGRYLLVLLPFALGLMAKPMLVSVPVVLLLLDYWPLGRFAERSRRTGIVREKIPFFILSAGSCIVTLIVQARGGSVGTVTAYPLGLRAANAVISLAWYMGKTVWPTRLAAIYPYPESYPWSESLISALVVLAVTVLAIGTARRFPYMIVGWGWFLVTLLPVIGLVQVGEQPRADRYTYVPLTGLFLIAAFGTRDLLAFLRTRRSAGGPAGGLVGGGMGQIAVGALVLIAFGCASRAQARHWKDSVSLWSHAVAVTKYNPRAHCYLGYQLLTRGRDEEASEQLALALSIQPRLAQAHALLAIARFRLGRTEEAIAHYSEALALDPRDFDSAGNLAIALVGQGRFEEAIAPYRTALRGKPESPGLWAGLADALARTGKVDEAFASYDQALTLSPYDPALLHGRGLVLARQGRADEAAESFRRAIRLAPREVPILRDLAWTLSTDANLRKRQPVEALEAARMAVGLAHPARARLLEALAAAQAEAGDYDGALATAGRALELAGSSGSGASTAGIEKQMEAYGAHRPFREDPAREVENPDDRSRIEAAAHGAAPSGGKLSQ